MPLTRLSLEERIRLVRYFSLYEKASAIQKAWVKEFGGDPPSRKTIAALNKKFDETGSVADLTRSGRPKTSRTEEKVALVQNAIRNDPTKSIRCLSSELGVNKASVHRIKQDTEKQSFLKLENRRLKEKISELQRRLDILEGKKPKKIKKIKEEKNSKIEEKLMPYLVSTGSTASALEQTLEMLGVEQGQTLTVQHGVGPDNATVITLLHTNNHAIEISDEDDKIRHLGIDEDGCLHAIEVGHEVAEASVDMLAEIGDESVQEIISEEIIEEQGINQELMEGEELMTQEEVILPNESGEDEVVTTEGIIVKEITKFESIETEGHELTQLEMPICFITSTSR